jgi:hypothetical protein
MVLICNNKLLSIEQFHKHRCEEKNRVRDILFDMKHNPEQYEKEVGPAPTFTGTIKRGHEHTGTHPIHTNNYDCKKDTR